MWHFDMRFARDLRGENSQDSQALTDFEVLASKKKKKKKGIENAD